MKVIIVAFDGHINSSGFKTFDEAREFILGRIPEDAFVQKQKDNYWVKYAYIEEQGTRKNKHVWELNEVELTMSGRSS